MIFDEYTPQVEAQILRDCQALLSAAGRDEEIVIVCESDKPTRVLDAIGMRMIPTLPLPKTWILYKTQEYWPTEPEWATTVIQRDLWQSVKEQKLLQVDEKDSNGYYLPPQGRLSPDTLSLERPAPNGYVPVDPSMIAIWNPNLG